MKARILLASVLCLASALPAAAQSVRLSFHDGKVDLSAQNASVRAILNEWARVGGTRLVNAERLAGPPVTVEFKDIYERQVLETLLRGVAGYIVGPRLTAGQPTTSGFDRIVLLPTSTAPRPTAASPVASRPQLPPQAFRRLGLPDGDVSVVQEENEPSNVPTAPRVETPADLRRRLGQLLQEPREGDDAVAPAPTAAPTNPFGVTTGAARPGVIVPVPGTARPQGGAPNPNDATGVLTVPPQ